MEDVFALLEVFFIPRRSRRNNLLGFFAQVQDYSTRPKDLVNFNIVMVEGGGGDEAETRQGSIVIQDRSQFPSLG